MSSKIFQDFKVLTSDGSLLSTVKNVQITDLMYLNSTTFGRQMSDECHQNVYYCQCATALLRTHDSYFSQFLYFVFFHILL